MYFRKAPAASPGGGIKPEGHADVGKKHQLQWGGEARRLPEKGCARRPGIQRKGKATQYPFAPLEGIHYFYMRGSWESKEEKPGVRNLGSKRTVGMGKGEKGPDQSEKLPGGLQRVPGLLAEKAGCSLPTLSRGTGGGKGLRGKTKE